MTYSVEKLHGQPIVLFTASDDYSITNELMQSIVDAEQVISVQREPVYYIQDLRAITIADMDEYIMGSNALNRGDSPLYHHPKIKKVISVTADDTLKMAFEGMQSALFGNTDVLIFDTLDEALDFAASGG
jgi:hypothetical protein